MKIAQEMAQVSSMTKTKRKPKMASFKRCEHFRVRAGLDKPDLVDLMEGKPKVGSVNQLENQHAIRATGAFKIANTLNAFLLKENLETFEVEKEVIIVKQLRT